MQFYPDTKNFVVFVDLDSIVEEQTEEGVKFIYDMFTMTTSANEELVSQNIDEYFELAKNAEIQRLSDEVRAKRNRLLEESDKYMALDRLDLDTSSAIKFLASLKNIFNNNYAVYRQQLRDITKQPNFPYDVEFPKKPKE